MTDQEETWMRELWELRYTNACKRFGTKAEFVDKVPSFGELRERNIASRFSLAQTPAGPVLGDDFLLYRFLCIPDFVIRRAFVEVYDTESRTLTNKCCYTLRSEKGGLVINAATFIAELNVFGVSWEEK